jgi:hypothetical protein
MKSLHLLVLLAKEEPITRMNKHLMYMYVKCKLTTLMKHEEILHG